MSLEYSTEATLCVILMVRILRYDLPKSSQVVVVVVFLSSLDMYDVPYRWLYHFKYSYVVLCVQDVWLYIRPIDLFICYMYYYLKLIRYIILSTQVVYW